MVRKLNPKPQTRLDTCLFVRIAPEHLVWTAGSFAILSFIKRRLGENTYLLKEVQAIKTGFALCTDSLAGLMALKEHINSLIDSISNCTIKRINNVNNVLIRFISKD